MSKKKWITNHQKVWYILKIHWKKLFINSKRNISPLIFLSCVFGNWLLIKEANKQTIKYQNKDILRCYRFYYSPCTLQIRLIGRCREGCYWIYAIIRAKRGAIKMQIISKILLTIIRVKITSQNGQSLMAPSNQSCFQCF